MFPIDQNFNRASNLQPSMDAITSEKTQSSLKIHELINSKFAQNGFISRDQQDRLSLSKEELSAMQSSSKRLLGGGYPYVYQGDVHLAPGKVFLSETQNNGYKIFISAHKEVHLTITYENSYTNQVILYNGPYTGERNFAQGRELGHYVVTIKNAHPSEDRTVNINIQECNGNGDCILF